MKKKKIVTAVLIVLAACLLIMGGIGMIWLVNEIRYRNMGDFIGLRFSPGYSDMRGARHSEELKREEDGKWVIVKEDREYYNAPTTVTVFAVEAEKLKEFETFLRKKVLHLSNRLKSPVFVTDYSPWSYDFRFRKPGAEKWDFDSVELEEYKVYLPTDLRILDQLKQSLQELRGEVLSVETKESEE